MKLNASNELKSRLTHAAANGSVIAADILTEMKRNADVSEIIRGGYNFFSTKRKRTGGASYQKIRIVFTTCNKNLNNKNFPDRNNPQAPWFPENRTDIDPSTFVGLFRNLPEYPETELSYFSSAICVDSKVTVQLHGGMQDFFEAYSEENYTPIADTTESNLHNSCMRYENRARNAADFYTNFAGAEILVARDGSNNVLARAVVWKNVQVLQGGNTFTGVSLIDRLCFTPAFVREMMRRQATALGITFRKQYNDYSHTKDVVALNNRPDEGVEAGKSYVLNLAVEVPACKWHKKGAPYMDTFYCVCMENGKMELRNSESGNTIATCRDTDGGATPVRKICPGCGYLHQSDMNDFCPSCMEKFYSNTIFGRALRSGTVEYQGKTYPSLLFKKKRPIPSMRLYLQVNRLYEVCYGTADHTLQYGFSLRQGGAHDTSSQGGTGENGHPALPGQERKPLCRKGQGENLSVCRGAYGRGTPQDRKRIRRTHSGRTLRYRLRPEKEKDGGHRCGRQERHMDMPEMSGGFQDHEMRLLRTGRDGMYRKRGSRHGLLRRLPFRTPVRPQGRQ